MTYRVLYCLTSVQRGRGGMSGMYLRRAMGTQQEIYGFR